ncbi:L,D-transpeptidase family protein [Sphingomonas sp. CFBP 13720]|uniref:L,D-transpeptidase family protein n=1 Tax=Sphingomonas sp. CFBP 13720 TaxID=2775302 RepID=UPI0017813F03|nr:L,D-transpeptidase family protein [Sphingomonas sp. CFBP 13720]MBD8679477.1 L,D-transpeptidase family protein [Sphingomonas sp. CFBP 13720]
MLLLGVVGATGAGAMLLVGAGPVDAPAAPPNRAAATALPVIRVTPVPVSSTRAAPVPVPEPAGMVVRRVLPIEGPFTHGRWVWDEQGAPASGPLVITIDLDAQVLSVFRDGYEIGAAVVLYGADWKPTPLGVLTITEKDADHVSNLYDAPMPYMLRLTDDGISIHGSDVQPGAATHGCIGVPVAFARKLFAVTKRGDRVVVTNGERLKLGGRITAG